MDIPDSNAVYYRMRAQQEQERAETTTVEGARLIHQNLANKYRSLAAMYERGQASDIVSPPGQLASHLI